MSPSAWEVPQGRQVPDQLGAQGRFSLQTQEWGRPCPRLQPSALPVPPSTRDMPSETPWQRVPILHSLSTTSVP